MATQPPLALVILAVTDLRRSLPFYEAAFGWKPIVQVPVYVEFELPRGMRVGLYAREAFERNTGTPAGSPLPARTTSTELYFFPDNLLQAISDLRSAGATELSPLAAREWGDEAAYFSDPDGNVLVVARELE